MFTSTKTSFRLADRIPAIAIFLTYDEDCVFNIEGLHQSVGGISIESINKLSRSISIDQSAELRIEIRKFIREVTSQFDRMAGYLKRKKEYVAWNKWKCNTAQCGFEATNG